MNRRLLLALATLAVVFAWAAAPGARADRLGGNYRGPDDIYVVHMDTSSTAPEASGTSGGSMPAGGTAPTGGGGDGGGDTAPTEPGGGGDGGSAPPDGGGGGDGGSTPPDGGGGGGDGGSTPPPPDSSGGGGSTAPPPDTGSAPTTGGSGAAPSGPSTGGAGTSGPGKGGKGAQQDDKDKIWPFYFESSKEEYVRTVLARKADPRIAPRNTSSYLLSSQPEPGRERRLIGETDRQEARDIVMGLLSDRDSHVRDAAVLALGKSGYKEAVRLIQKVAESDTDPAVREDALLALGLSGQSDAALPFLLKALNAPSSDRREKRQAYAALGLGLLGNREGAAEPLRRLYQATAGRPDGTEEAICAATALGMLADPEALPIFERALASKGTPEVVRCYTLHAAGKYGAASDEKVRRAALDLIGGALQQKKDTVRQSALLALGGFDDAKAVAILAGKDGIGESDNYARNFAAHALGRIAGRIGPSTPEYAAIAKKLAEAGEKETRDRWLFQASNLALAVMAYADQEKQLLSLFAETKLTTHSASAAALSLGMLGSPTPAVAKQLTTLYTSRSSGTNVQAYSGLALAMAGAPGAADELTRTLKGDSKPAADVARISTLALGLVGGAKEADILVGILNGDHLGQQAESAKFFLMGAAVQGLGLIGDGDSVKKLKPVSQAGDWEHRAFAAAALGYLLEPRAENRVSPRISEIFRHHNYHVPAGVVKAVQSTL